MINWKALRKLVQGQKQMEEALEELRRDRVVSEVEDKLQRGKFTVEDGKLHVRLGNMDIPEMIQAEQMLSSQGYKGVDSHYRLPWHLREYTEFEFYPKEE